MSSSQTQPSPLHLAREILGEIVKYLGFRELRILKASSHAWRTAADRVLLRSLNIDVSFTDANCDLLREITDSWDKTQEESLTFQPRSDPSETTTSAAKRKFLLRAMVHLINRCIGLRHISIDLREFSSVQVAFLKQQMSDIMLPSADFRTHGDVTHGSPFRWSECEYVSVDTALQCEILQQASACAKRIRRLAFVACFPSLGEMELCYGYNAALRAAVLPTSLDRRFPGLIIHMFPQVECVVINAFAADIAAGTSLLDFGPLEILFLGALKQNWDGSKVKKLSVEIPLVYAFREVHRRHPSSEEQQQPMSNALWVWYEMLALRIVWVGVSLEEVCIRAAWPHYVRARINGWVERVTSRSRDCHSFPYGLLDPNDPEERASF